MLIPKENSLLAGTLRLSRTALLTLVIGGFGATGAQALQPVAVSASPAAIAAPVLGPSGPAVLSVGFVPTVAAEEPQAAAALAVEVVRAPAPAPRALRQPPAAPAAIDRIIRDAAARWDADPQQLLRVAYCESSFKPDAFNPKNQDSGLFQFIPETWRRQSPRAGYAGASPFDPVANANTAAMLFSQGLARYWTCK